MKRSNLFSCFVLLFLFVACGENQNRNDNTEETMAPEQTYQDPEEAMAEWGDSWKSNDPQQIISRTADDAILVLNGAEVPQDSIQSFLQSSGSAMNNLQLQSLGKNSSDRMAYDTGTFSHGYTNDTTSYRGTYTFIWEREENEEGWKVKVMNISNVHPEFGMSEDQQTN